MIFLAFINFIHQELYFEGLRITCSLIYSFYKNFDRLQFLKSMVFLQKFHRQNPIEFFKYYNLIITRKKDFCFQKDDYLL